MSGELPPTADLIRVSLQAAVPLWVARLREQPWDQIQRRLPELSQTIAEHGDVILYRSNVKGETARAFNALAEAIAALSFVPGGVTVFGEHWESTHPDLERT